MAKVHAVVYALILLAQPWAATAFFEEIAGFAVGAVVVGFGGPFALAGIGFTGAGIAAGSIAASMMSVGVPVAALQSAGAAGLAVSTIVAGGLAGAGIAHAASHDD